MTEQALVSSPGWLRRVSSHPRLASLRGEGMEARAMRGSIWTILGFGLSQLLRLGSNLILTRLLYPKAFGLIALVWVFITALQMFSDVGIRPSIVQNKNGEEPEFLDTAWTMSVIRGAILWAAACAIAYPAAAFYDEPLLFPLLCFVGSTAFIRGFETTGFALGMKHLKLGRVALVELGAQGIGAVLMIIWALIDRSVWAIASGSILMAIASVIGGHFLLNTRRHRFRLDGEASTELFRFGKWIFLSSLITFAAQSGDRVLLPKLLGVETFTFYSLAFMLAELPPKVFHQLSQKVLFPMYSEVVKSGDVARLNAVYGKFVRTSWPVYLLPVVMMFGASQIVSLLYDPRYAETATALSVIGGAAYLRMMLRSQEGLLLAIGNSRDHMFVNLFRLVSWVPLAYWGANEWGLAGFCLGIVGSDAATLLLQRVLVIRCIRGISPRPDLILTTILCALYGLLYWVQ